MSDDFALDPVAIDGTPAQAFASHRSRASAVARAYALEHPLNIAGGKVKASEDNTMLLVAHLQAASDDPTFHAEGQELSRILAPKMLRNLEQGNQQVGTSVNIGPFTREGDYDMALKGLMIIPYRYHHLLTADDVNFILDTLVPSHLVGPHEPDLETHSLARVIQFPETENHMLMINSTRYLVNQLFWDRTGDTKYDNRANGLTKWLLGYMHTIAKHDFLEFNARPYQRLSLHALFNLHEFARDESIRTGAQILLDYIMVKFAVSSSRHRRVNPFRRLKENTNRPGKINDLVRESVGGDPVTGFFMMYAGLMDREGKPIAGFPRSWWMEALIAGLAAYRPPTAAYILAMTRDIPPFQHRFYHGARPPLPAGEPAGGGVEIYYRSPSFLLTAGGMFLNSGYGSDEFLKYKDTAIAQSTTLLPTRADVAFADLIRFDPYPDERRAVNTGVHLGFACGANLRPSNKKTFVNSSSRAPALGSHNGRLFLAWKGSGNQNLNSAKVYATGGLGLDGIEGLEGQVVLNDTSEQSPAVASHNGRLFMAWRGAGNNHLNLMFSDDDGKTFHGTRTFSDASDHAPALVSHNGRLFMAWTGVGNEHLNVAKVALFGNTAGGFGIEGLEQKVVLNDTSEEGPALASHNGRLFLAWKGSGNDNLNLMFSEDNGATFRGTRTFSDTSHYAPGLASHDGRLFMAWTGRGDGNLNVAKVALFGNTAGGFGIEGLEGKAVLGDTSEQAPALASHDGRLFLAWKGAGNDNLNLMSSRSGLFEVGPWYFCNLSQFGFYVAIYRTPPAQPDQLDTPLENLGFLYAMEASDIRFEDFRRLTLERNTSLPAQLQYGRNYSFHAPNGRRFSFWLHPSLANYPARIAAADEAHPVADFASLPLIEGPYLSAPGGHDGLIEIRHPGCEATPLVLDFRDPATPVRLDNMATCAQPWLDRAEALLRFAQLLLSKGRQKEAIAALADRAKIYRQLADLDRPRYGPLLIAALTELLVGLWNLTEGLLVARRINEVSEPAQQLIEVYQQAVAAGAEATGTATTVVSLSEQLAAVDLLTEATRAAEVAVELLRGVQPPTSEEPGYLSLLGGALLNLVARLIQGGRINEVSAPALESVEVYRRAVAAGAEATGTATTLLGLSQQLLGVGLSTEATRATEAAVDLLAGAQPPTTEEAGYLSLLGGALLNLAVRLIDAGRINEASAPALESIEVYRRAVAAGADATIIAGYLLSLSQQLLGVGLSAEATSAAQAAVDLLRSVQPPTTEEAGYLSLLGGALLNLAVRLIDAGRINEASAPALESIEVYRRAVAAGADATIIAGYLLSLSQQLAAGGLSAEAASAAQAAADLAP